MKSGLLTLRGFTVATEELTPMHLAKGPERGAVWLDLWPTGGRPNRPACRPG